MVVGEQLYGIDKYYAILNDEQLLYNNGNYNASQYCNSWGYAQIKTLFHPYLLIGVIISNFILLPFGLTGNILSFMIMSKDVNGSKSRLYLSVLAVTDFIALFFSGFLASIMYLGPIVFDYYNMQQPQFFYDLNANGLCQTRIFIAAVSKVYSVSIVSMFSVERAIVICSPFTRAALTFRRTIKCLVMLFLYSVIISTPVFLVFEVVVIGGKNVCKSNNKIYINSYLTSITEQIVPMILIAGSNIVIVYKLKKRSESSTLSANKKMSDSNTNQDLKVTKRLLAISCFFIITCLPQMIASYVSSIACGDCKRLSRRPSYSNTRIITAFIFSLNFASNFILYCFTGATFWTQAKALLCCKYTKFNALNSSGDNNAVALRDLKKRDASKHQKPKSFRQSIAKMLKKDSNLKSDDLSDLEYIDLEK